MTIIVVVLIIVAIVSIGRALFGGAAETTIDTDIDRGRTALLETESDHGVSLTVRGPIVANENFKSYRILITPASRSMDAYKGYLDESERSKKLDNNTEAYEQFVYALDKADMMKGKELKDDKLGDLRGICATGYVYEYAVLIDDKPVKHLWTSTCDGSKGSLVASTTQLNNLFLKQIPDADDLIPFKRSGLELQL